MRRFHSRFAVSPALAVLFLMTSRLAGASVVTPMDVEDLARRAPLIAVGVVESILSAPEAGSRLHTYVTIRTESSISGADGLAAFTLKQPGGLVGERFDFVYGAPGFERGERVLVFAVPTSSGHLQVSGLFQGKYRVEQDGAGEWTAVRDPGEGASGGSGASRRMRLAELLTRVRVALSATSRPFSALGDLRSAPAPLHGEEHEATPRFMMDAECCTVLWRDEAGAGQPVPFEFNPAFAPVVPGGARAAFRDALAAWTAVEGSTLQLVDGGDTTNHCAAGIFDVRVDHGDPCDWMEDFDAETCSGVVAFGGVGGYLAYPRWGQIVDAFVALNDGIDCFTAVPGNYAEIMAHGLGHAIGIGHACGDEDSPDCAEDPVLDEALMRAFPHGDGRGADIRQDDVDAARFLYAPIAFADIRLNDTSFTTGETIHSTLNFSSRADVDVYAFLVYPSGSFFFVGAPGPNAVAPVLSSLPAGYFPHITSDAVFGGGEAPGQYYLGIALVLAGRDPYVASNLLAADAVSYTLVP